MDEQINMQQLILEPKILKILINLTKIVYYTIISNVILFILFTLCIVKDFYIRRCNKEPKKHLFPTLKEITTNDNSHSDRQLVTYEKEEKNIEENFHKNPIKQQNLITSTQAQRKDRSTLLQFSSAAMINRHTTKVNNYLASFPLWNGEFAETDMQSRICMQSVHREESAQKIEKKNTSKPVTAKKSKIPQEIKNKPSLIKFWNKRYQLFHKYDDGIQLDEESWFSVTPEDIAKDQAKKCKCRTIIDAFCGAGGNSIQFAFTCERVIAIDIDPKKISMARHNAKIYNVENKIEFIVGDFMQLASQLTADVVFLSPPWGGFNYKNKKIFDIADIMPPVGGKKIFDAAKGISNTVAYYVPKNINLQQISRLVKRNKIRIEKNITFKKKAKNIRVVACTAYYSFPKSKFKI